VNGKAARTIRRLTEDTLLEQGLTVTDDMTKRTSRANRKIVKKYNWLERSKFYRGAKNA